MNVITLLISALVLAGCGKPPESLLAQEAPANPPMASATLCENLRAEFAQGHYDFIVGFTDISNQIVENVGNRAQRWILFDGAYQERSDTAYGFTFNLSGFCKLLIDKSTHLPTVTIETTAPPVSNCGGIFAPPCH